MVVNMAHVARKYGLPQIAAWTLLLACMLGITLYVHHQDTLKEALLEARNYYMLNYHYRAWNAEIGGLYGPVEKIAPNPYLSVPDRDITTLDHRQLTLVNPAYMSRMVFEQVRSDSAEPIICRLTSLKPINPVNSPDNWEREALTAFEQTGGTERFQVISLNGAPYLRLISRFVTEKSCLKCHETQGYKPGDIRGAISIAVPLTPYFIAESKTRQTIVGGYLLLWMSGSAGLVLVSRKRYDQAVALATEAAEREAAQESLRKQAIHLQEEIAVRCKSEEALRESEGRYRLLLESVTNYVFTTLIEDGKAIATSHGPGCLAVTGYSAEDYAADPDLWLRMVPEDERPAVLEQANSVLAGKMSPPLEHRIIHKNGQTCWIRNTPVPYYNNDGTLIAFDGIITDITERKQTEETIRKWQSILLSAQRIAHLGSWELDLVHNELTWSDEIYRIFGLQPQEFRATYDAFMDVVHPEDKDHVHAAYNRSIENDIPYDIIHRIVRKYTGEIRYVHEKCEHTKDASGRIIRSLGTVHDVTERKLAEEALHKAEEEWAKTFDAIVDPIMILDTNYRIIKANKALAAKLELTPQEAKGLACYQIIHQAGEPPEYCPYTRLLADGQPHAAEFNAPGLGGYFISSVSPLLGPAGELQGSICISRDITDRKQADSALQREKEFLNSLLQGSAIATFVLDPQHRVLLWNHACEVLTGVKGADVIGSSLHWRAFYPHERPCLADIVIDGQPEQMQQLYVRLSRSMLTSEGLQAEGSYPDLNGLDRYILFNAAPIRDSNGTLLGAIETLQDITDQKALEAQLFQSQKMEAIGQLAGGVAHDFNNILTAIIGFGTVMDMQMDKDDPQKANLSHVLAAADRATDLTRSLLAFSRKQVINPQPTDLNQLIMKVDKFLQRIIGEDIALRTTFNQEAVTVNADSGQIEQVLMNLATNARDAMPHGGQLTIETGTAEIDAEYIKAHGSGEPGWYASVSVADTGEGMDEATCQKVFEPFFTTKEAGKGTGLGLSIVFGIIKQHNGFINVSSEPGKGTTFRILLPLIQSAVTAVEAREEEVIEQGVGTILVADDEASMRDLTDKALGLFGYTVITAENGRDALARFKENQDRIELVILDILMPELNGKDAFNEMKKINPALKAIFISGYDQEIIQERGLLEQGLEFVAKPLNLRQLVIKVREALEGKA